MCDPSNFTGVFSQHETTTKIIKLMVIEVRNILRVLLDINRDPPTR